jgi:hypothetical protein
VFTFTDKYWYGQWSDTPITYKAVSTLGAIASGTTLMFVPQGERNKLTSITITKDSFGTINVERESSYNVYPRLLHNSDNTTQGNTGKEDVTVYYDGEDPDDFGKIIVTNNVVRVVYGKRVYEEVC